MKKNLLKLAAIPLLATGALITAVLTSDVQERDSVAAIGIVLEKGGSLDQIASQFTTVEDTAECNEYDEEGQLVTENTCATSRVLFEGEEVQVYLLVAGADTSAYLDFPTPLAGSLLYPNVPADAEQRLVRMMEEHGESEYRIIYAQ